MKKIALICCCSLFLSACFGGRSPDPVFYKLTDGINAQTISTQKTAILINDVRVPDLVFRPQIVLKSKKMEEINISEFNRWAEPVPNMIKQTLLDNLTKQLPNAFIKPNNYDVSGQYNYVLLVEVNHFIGQLKNNAQLDVWWTIKNANGNIVARKRFSDLTPIGDSYQSYVEGQSHLVEKLSTEIAKTIK